MKIISNQHENWTFVNNCIEKSWSIYGFHWWIGKHQLGWRDGRLLGKVLGSKIICPFILGIELLENRGLWILSDTGHKNIYSNSAKPIIEYFVKRFFQRLQINGQAPKFFKYLSDRIFGYAYKLQSNVKERRYLRYCPI